MSSELRALREALERIVAAYSDSEGGVVVSGAQRQGEQYDAVVAARVALRASEDRREWEDMVVAALAAAPAPETLLDESGPDLVFSTSPAPEGIDTDCMFLASPNRISVHISRRAINAQIARRRPHPDHTGEDQ